MKSTLALKLLMILSLTVLFTAVPALADEQVQDEVSTLRSQSEDYEEEPVEEPVESEVPADSEESYDAPVEEEY